ncbi:vanadium-dependent haloperoxidase [Deinococcus sp. QL22]|uniref:vanadium-dependent haloperoxidase n=1 Tax=Deinococcus sp. QL22 TaxID=2939437 RepID=UPI0020179EA1|nr:vanadium-dependent haloperoxidase [Deinococcus sp. QL22]UQN06663.1 vanadium-dependent haloperoxidase [Deinococcus sp. QL22]
MAPPSRTFLTYAAHPNIQRRISRVSAGTPTNLSADLVRGINTETLALIRARKLNPVRAARALALTLATVSDTQTLVSASGRALNTDAVAAIAAERLQSYLFPQDTAALEWGLQERLAGLPHGADEHAVAGVIANCVLLFARADHADRPLAIRIPATAEGKWKALPGQNAMEVNWGWVSPIATSAATLPQVTPPPAWNAPAFAADRADFAVLQSRLTDADRALALYWAAGAGTVTPAGMWLEQAAALSRQHALGGPDTAQALALTAVATHNAFIACWRAKFQYVVARPQNWMSGPDGVQAGWKPVIVTPPFPSYPSGHASVSGAAAQVLSALFPSEAVRLTQAAQDAAYSRVVGGIHWAVDGAAGLDMGTRVAGVVLAGK